jgi:type VI secretion system secreted protein VgrG
MAISYLNLKIDGQLVGGMILNQVSVMQELNRHWWCHMQCRHLEDQRLGADSQPTIRVEDWLGKDLQVVAIENGDQQVIFDGFVLEVELIYELSSAYSAVIQGVTKSYKMDIAGRQGYYAQKTLSDIAQQLANNAGLKASVQCQAGRPMNYVQCGESDFEFLQRLVDDHGAWMRPSAAGIEIFDKFQDGTEVKWQKASEADALLSFSLRGRLAPAGFNGAHYDFHKMKSQTYQDVSQQAQFFDGASHMVDATNTASKQVLPSSYLHQRSRAVTLDDFEQRLKKESLRSTGSSVTGSGQTQNRKMLPGNSVRLAGTIDADGTYGVTQVSHSWDPTGYTNQFSCTPWKNYTDPHPPEMNAWNGLVSARVADHNDPAKMGRIKVHYFWQEDSIAHWARMLTPHAGSDRGFMFLPEVGDEVVVGFEDGDLERPLILGCVWNGVDLAPRQAFWGDDIAPNEVKRLVTKSGNRLQMVDTKGKESIVLSTPNSAKLSLFNNAPQTGNNMVLLSSDNGDIFLSAPNGRVHIKCKYFSREVG